MAEWKKYDETTFTDFGSVGETVPVDMPMDGGMNGFDGSTVPVNGSTAQQTPFEKTIPDSDFSDFGSDSFNMGSWNDVETKFDNTGFVKESGETVRPATGWLVCIEGKNIGVDYRLYQGYSYIGRDPAQNQVAIPDDHISSVPSARILYDADTRRFYINECNGARNPVKLNGQLIDGRVVLAAYDIIHLGNTKLLFVPLCTEKFSWEDTNKAE